MTARGEKLLWWCERYMRRTGRKSAPSRGGGSKCLTFSKKFCIFIIGGVICAPTGCRRSLGLYDLLIGHTTPKANGGQNSAPDRRKTAARWSSDDALNDALGEGGRSG